MAQTINYTSSAVSTSQIASTLPHLRSVVRDNVSDATPLLSFLMGELGSQRRAALGFPTDGLPGAFMGGRDIVVPIQISANTSVGSYSDLDAIDVTRQDTDVRAIYPIRQNAGSLVVSGRERRANKGEAAIYSLMESKTSRLINDLREELARQAVSDGTGNGGKDILGLAAIVGTGTLATINPSTEPQWQPGGVASGNNRHAIDTATGFAASGLDTMNAIYNNLTQGQNAPDGIFFSKDAIEFYIDALDDNIRYNDVRVGDGSFQALQFRGTDCFFDFSLGDGFIYFLNSRHLMFMRDREADFDWINEGVQPHNQDAFVRLMIVEGNVVTDNRRMLGVMSSVTA